MGNKFVNNIFNLQEWPTTFGSVSREISSPIRYELFKCLSHPLLLSISTEWRDGNHQFILPSCTKFVWSNKWTTRQGWMNKWKQKKKGSDWT